MGLDIFINKVKYRRLGYFRKVNFLVKFFTDKGFDVEHQTPFTIYKQSIEELKSLCEEVLKDNSKASELLPTMSGFFFGSTKYDDYYFKDVEKVKNWCDEILPEFDNLEDNECIQFSTWY